MRSILPLLALSVGCVPVPHADTTPSFNHLVASNRDGDVAQCYHQALDDLVENLDPDYDLRGCAVAIADWSGVAYVTAGGLAHDPACEGGQAEPVDYDATFGLGSVSKMLTSVALLRLWEDGHLGVDDDDVPLPLTQIEAQDVFDFGDGLLIPEFVRSATLHELLTHTAGIDDGQWQLWLGYHDLYPMDLSSDLNQPIRWDEVAPQMMPALPPTTAGRLQAMLDAGRDPGSAPELALFATAGPDTAIAGAKYSNIGYLVLGAIIDHTVVQAGFDGYGDAFGGSARGYESWVWWVWNGEGQSYPPGPTSLALNHPWREDAAGIDGLVVDYRVDDQGVCDPAADWHLPGWEAPSGGWTATVGDLARVGLVVAERRVLAEETWDLAITVYSVAANTPYGYGLRLPDGVPDTIEDLAPEDDPPEWRVGHDGVVLGYQAGVFSFEPGAEPMFPQPMVAAYACNTVPEDDTDALLVDGPQAVRDAWEQSQVVCGPVGGTPGEILAMQWWEELEAEAAYRLQGSSLAQVQTEVRDELSRSSTGVALLRAVDAGDWATATVCTLAYLDARGGWACR